MVEPEKPFACLFPDCGMTFTNEDHLNVHTKKHDMVLQLGSEQKGVFVADQTPTPTRFIRNCEEVGLFQDLQNVTANPFDEGFKRAMETKHQGVCKPPWTETTPPTDDVLHTPQMVYPMETAESTLFTNTQRNVIISQSSSDVTIKGFETHTVSKLSNEITLIVNEDVTISNIDSGKELETLYDNDDFSIKSNVITKDGDKEINMADKEVVINHNKLNVDDKVPIMSQKSIDYVVDSLTTELTGQNINETQNDNHNKGKTEMQQDINEALKAKVNELCKKMSKKTNESSLMPKILPKKEDSNMKDYEVMIKLPNGTLVRMKPVESNKNQREKYSPSLLRNKVISKVKEKFGKNNTVSKVTKACTTNTVPNIVNIPPGTLIPVTLVDQAGAPLSNDDLNKVPITKIGMLPQQKSALNDLNVSDTKTNKILRNVRGTSACLTKVSSSENVTITTPVINKVVSTNTNNVSNAPICRVTPIPNLNTLTANPSTLVLNEMTLAANSGTLVADANGIALAANSASLTPTAISLSGNISTITPDSVQFTSVSTNSTITPNKTKPERVSIKKGFTQLSISNYNRPIYYLNGDTQTIPPVSNKIKSPKVVPCPNSATLTRIFSTKEQKTKSVLKNVDVMKTQNKTSMTVIVNGKPMVVTRLNTSTSTDVTSEKQVESHNERETEPNNDDSTYNIQVSQPYQIDQATGKRKMNLVTQEDINHRLLENNKRNDARDDGQNDDYDDDCVMVGNITENTESAKRSRIDLECRSAASKRYRARLKEAMKIQTEENRQLREANQKLIAEKAVLKLVIMEHMKRCPNGKEIADLINSLSTVIPDS